MALNPNPSQLDQTQILQRVFDKDNDALRTDTNVDVTISGDVVVDIDAATGDNIAIANADGTKKVTVTTTGPINALDVNIASSALPSGAATSANQTSELTKLDTLHSDLVVIEGKQDTGNTSLSSIDSKLASLGQKAMTGSEPVVIASDQTPINVFTTDYALQYDNTSTPNVTYIGYATIGSSTASAIWQIKKMDETSGIVITWADSNNNFDNIWDNRVSLTYG